MDVAAATARLLEALDLTEDELALVELFEAETAAFHQARGEVRDFGERLIAAAPEVAAQLTAQCHRDGTLPEHLVIAYPS